MSFRPTPIERAFQLAKSGEYEGLQDVLRQLKVEGLSVSQIEGRAIRTQLRDLCVAARQT